MSILAIDPATQLGWARENNGRITHGTESFHNTKWDGAGVRFLKFFKWLEENGKVDLIIYEAVQSHSSIYAAHLYGAWISTIQAHGERYGIPYSGVPVGTIKKHWTGNGNAKKQAMIDEARKRGFNPKDDNAADALAILDYAMVTFPL